MTPRNITSCLIALTLVLALCLRAPAQQDSRRYIPETERTPNTLLQWNYPEEALELLKQGKTLIHQEDKSHWLPLHHAVRNNHLKVVEWLLENGADVDAKYDYNDSTSLHLADEPEIVAALLKFKPTLKARRYEDTPLRRAAEKYADETEPPAKQKCRKIIDLLRTAGAEYDLTSAIYLDDLPEVRKLLAADPELAYEGRPELPLRVAAKQGRLEICKEILKIEGVDLNDFEHGGGYPIIYDALPHPPVVKLLIDRGADIERRVTWTGGRSGIQIIHDDAPLLQYAADMGTPETVKLLLDHGADPFVETVDFRNSEQPQTALDVAAIFGKVENLLEIIRHPRFAEAPKEQRQPLLDRCLVNGTIAFQDDPVDHVKLYKGLLEAGADPNAVYNNRTALQEAAAFLIIKVAEDEEPEDEETDDDLGKTDRDDQEIVTEEEDEDTQKRNQSLRNGIQVLRESGAKLDLFTAVALIDVKAVREILTANPDHASMIGPDGVPAIHMAIERRSAKIVTLLLDAGCNVNQLNRPPTSGFGGLESTPQTPLDVAQSWGSTKILDLLAKHNAQSASELEETKPPPPNPKTVTLNESP